MRPVKRPDWTGVPGETVVLVGRGEPARSTGEVIHWVGDQVRAYLAEHTDVQPGDVNIERLARYIVTDQYRPNAGAPRVRLDREHLFAYIRVVRGMTGEIDLTVPPKPQTAAATVIEDANKRIAELTEQIQEIRQAAGLHEGMSHDEVVTHIGRNAMLLERVGEWSTDLLDLATDLRKTLDGEP